MKKGQKLLLTLPAALLINSYKAEEPEKLTLKDKIFVNEVLSNNTKVNSSSNKNFLFVEKPEKLSYKNNQPLLHNTEVKNIDLEEIIKLDNAIENNVKLN